MGSFGIFQFGEVSGWPLGLKTAHKCTVLVVGLLKINRLLVLSRAFLRGFRGEAGRNRLAFAN